MRCEVLILVNVPNSHFLLSLTHSALWLALYFSFNSDQVSTKYMLQFLLLFNLSVQKMCKTDVANAMHAGVEGMGVIPAVIGNIGRQDPPMMLQHHHHHQQQQQHLYHQQQQQQHPLPYILREGCRTNYYYVIFCNNNYYLASLVKLFRETGEKR